MTPYSFFNSLFGSSGVDVRVLLLWDLLKDSVDFCFQHQSICFFLRFRYYVMSAVVAVDDDNLCFTATFVHMVGSQRWNTLQICLRRDLNTGDSDLWSNTLLFDRGGAPVVAVEEQRLITNIWTVTSDDMRKLEWCSARDLPNGLWSFSYCFNHRTLKSANQQLHAG